MRISATIATLALLTSTAYADKKPTKQDVAAAKKHMENAAKASQDGRFDEAIKELEAAYALDPQPMLLLARGHAHAKAEQCDKAIELYEQYLATNPKKDLAESAQSAIDACKETIAANAPPPPPPPPEPPKQTEAKNIGADAEVPGDIAKGTPPPPRPEVATTEPAPTAPRRVDVPSGPSGSTWYKDPVVLGLGIAGIGGLVGGVALYTSARGKLDDSEAAPTYDAARDLVDQAHSRRTFSIVAGAAGAALVGGAVFYYVRKYGGAEQSRVTVTPTPSGGVVGWTGRF